MVFSADFRQSQIRIIDSTIKSIEKFRTYENAEKHGLPERYEADAKDILTEKPQTNADRIRSMTDEELANLLDEVGIGSFLADKYPCSECTEKINCDVCYLEWLRAESEE